MDSGQIRRLLLLFLAAQLLGIFAGAALVQSALAYPVEFEGLNVAPGGESGSALSSLLFLAYIVAGAVAMIIVLRFYKGVLLFRLVEAFMLLGASGILFFVLFGWFGVPHFELLALACALGVAAAKFFVPDLKNFAAVLASAGVGAVFGFSLDFFPAAVFVVGLSVYDYLSVFWTRHMVYMARELGSKNLSFSVSATSMEAPGEGGKPVRTTLELGTGDLVVPILLSVSAYKLAFSPVDAFAVTFGSLTGLCIVLWYVSSRRTFLPALPPITFCALLALGLSRALGWGYLLITR
ncbi:MAG: presenilin family intramembrane aspartyl protease [Candidatus ainarchaeum sp.]|nr:presenilin family intramembrane aspartyl protease [Candidatus ainarchaeum sp.]